MPSFESKVYGDAAQFTREGDKFTALLLAIPLFKPRGRIEPTCWAFIRLMSLSFCFFCSFLCFFPKQSLAGEPWRKTFLFFILNSVLDAGQMTMRPIYHRTMWSLQAAFAGRRPQAGPPGDENNIPARHKKKPPQLEKSFAVVEHKGDWEYHVGCWNLKTYWRTNALCHVCSAARRAEHGVPFTMFGHPWRRRTARESLMLSMGDAPNPMILIPGFHPSIIRFCSMHVLALGIYQTLAAEVLLWMSEHKVFCDRPQAGLDEHLRYAFHNFKEWQTREHVTCSGRVFTSKRLHVSPGDFPWLGYKAFNCRVVLAWLAAARLLIKNAFYKMYK